MSHVQILRRINLRPTHKPTGKTRHYLGADELPAPSELKIVRYIGNPGVYLIYLDKSGCELTDTYHETLDDAIAQAEFEFGITPNEWDVLA
ncbi:MAG TPA: hypothetical protein VGJ57_07710 [Nitrospirales bacterium]|jgi:hypothetical protein